MDVSYLDNAEEDEETEGDCKICEPLGNSLNTRLAHLGVLV